MQNQLLKLSIQLSHLQLYVFAYFLKNNHAPPSTRCLGFIDIELVKKQHLHLKDRA